MYTVTESTKRNDEYFDFVKELDSIKGRRLKCSGGCEICSSRGGGRKLNTPLTPSLTIISFTRFFIYTLNEKGQKYLTTT